MKTGRALVLDNLDRAVEEAMVKGLFDRRAEGSHAHLWSEHHDPIMAELEDEAAAWGRAQLQQGFLFMLDRLGWKAERIDFGLWEEDGEEVLAKANMLGWLGKLGINSPEDLLDLVDRVVHRFLQGSAADAAKERILTAFVAGQEARASSREAARRRLVTVRLRAKKFRAGEEAANALKWLQVAGAENARSWGEQTRSGLRRVVIRGAQEGWAPSKLRSELFDRFGEANRDWRRIAITEQNEAAGQGFIASQKPGTKVKRFEMADACAWCRAIHERVMTVVAPQKADKDGETEVWLGKTNVGRSAAPRKRLEDGRLVERPADERWWVAAGTQHPHCRGFWLTA